MANYISPIFATGQAVDDALSKALTALQPNTTFAVNGTVGATTPNTGAFTTLSAKATQDTATLGSELVNNGTFESDLSGWADGAGWTYSAGVAAHAAGSTETLVQTIGGLVVDSYYQLSFTLARTAGTLSVSLGTSAGGVDPMSAAGVKTTAFKAAATSQDLTFTPSSDFVGSVDSVTLKPLIQNAAPTLVLKSSTGTVVSETRTGLSAGNNLYVGQASGSYSTAGSLNTAFGRYALSAISTGSYNTAVGGNCQRASISGDYNTGVGLNTQYNLTSGRLNNAVGSGAQLTLTTGFANCAFGLNSQYYLTTGSQNVALGNLSLQLASTGSNNVAVGHSAASNLTTGNNNTAVGYYAGSYIGAGTTQNATASNSIFIGNVPRAQADGQTNQIVIGDSVVGLGSNSTTIGNSSTTQAKIFGSLEVTGPLKMNGYTVATLPSAVVGMRTYVTDATAPTYNATVTGGGAVKVPVFYNGTNWVTA